MTNEVTISVDQQSGRVSLEGHDTGIQVIQGATRTILRRDGKELPFLVPGVTRHLVLDQCNPPCGRLGLEYLEVAVRRALAWEARQ